LELSLVIGLMPPMRSSRLGNLVWLMTPSNPTAQLSIALMKLRWGLMKCAVGEIRLFNLSWYANQGFVPNRF
jgi:hypothetical protein